jgi:two-component system, NarL family, sensor histidine kinase BarA
MSYRAFKRLLGETSLERKCHVLFGIVTLVLITTSFWLYAMRTERLAYDQTMPMGRLLVNWLVSRQHMQHLNLERWEWDRTVREESDSPSTKNPALTASDWTKLQSAMNDLSDSHLPLAVQNYQQSIILPRARSRIHQPEEGEVELLKEFMNDPSKTEDRRILPAKEAIHYYGAIRATARCLSCHPATAEEREAYTDLHEGDLMALVKISIPTRDIETGAHFNRAILIATALVTALLIMAGSYIIVRYVIVKPVKHLKEVSDAISAGELNVRSEIQTGDEFEDLSYAFNRMLRNLVSMQDRWRKVNADLDRKVDELAQANLALYESNRLKSDFLATVSHELRTPLNSILGFSEVLLSADGLNDKQERWVQNIQTSGGRLLNLINDILDLAKIEAGKMQVRLEEFSIHDICEGLLSMFRPLAEKKHIDLRGQIEPSILLLRQDAGKLQQILSNLLSNAIKFTPEGGRITLRAEMDALYIVLTVTDTGVGIAPEEQELVFEKFRQSGTPLTREHAGTGLGLSIVRELSKLLGGEAILRSELGRGSTFTIRLPLQLSEEPRLEFDLAKEHIDLTKAQRIDVRMYSAATDADTAANVATGQPHNGTDPEAMAPDHADQTHSSP